MAHQFETGFFVREPAWHKLGTVLQEYPGRDEAMRLAGHGFHVSEHRVLVQHLLHLPLEYLDHVRKSRSAETYFTRNMLSPVPLKRRVAALAMDAANA
jgi:hypothetical protein